jgi:hypothetical protein
VLSRNELQSVVTKVHGFRELHGCRIGFRDRNGRTQLLHRGLSPSINYARVAVVIEEVHVRDPHANQAARALAAAAGPSPPAATKIVQNHTNLKAEMIGAGLSSGFALIAAFGVFGGVAAEIPTGGASTFLVVCSWTGMITSGIQAINGLARVAAIVADPTGDSLQRIDDGGPDAPWLNQFYKYGILFVDAAGVISGFGGLYHAGSNAWALWLKSGALKRLGFTVEKLKAMNRAQRAVANKTLIEESSRTPEGRAALIKAAQDAKIPSGVFTDARASKANAAKVMKLVSDETLRRLHASVLGNLATLGGTTASATAGDHIGSASGSIYWFIQVIDTGKLN